MVVVDDRPPVAGGGLAPPDALANMIGRARCRRSVSNRTTPSARWGHSPRHGGRFTGAGCAASETLHGVRLARRRQVGV